MYSVDLSHYNTPILLDSDGREHIFNKDNQIIRINEIGYFTKDELKKYGIPELEVNEFYRLEDEIYPNSSTVLYPINKVFREDYNKINSYKSTSPIKKYQIKTTHPILKSYLENFKTQRIRDLQDKKEVEKKERVDKEIKTYTIEQSKERLNNLISDYQHRQVMAKEEQRRQRELNKLDQQFNQDLFNQHQQQKRPEIKPSNQLTLSFPIIQPKDKKEWLKSNLPYRSPNKVKNLYFNKFGKSDISLHEINKQTEHFNDFNVKDSQKKFSLKTYSNVYHSFIGDIFFQSNKAAFLLLININTRKAYAYQLGKIECKDEIDLVNGIEKVVYQYAIGGKKTADELMKAFNKHLQIERINVLKFDGESAIKSPGFQQFLIQNNIKFVSSLPNAHTSLSLIDRLCLTVRDIAFNLGYDLILTQNQMNEILNYYNNTRHEGLTKIILVSHPELKVKYPNGISPNDMNSELEKIYVIECKKWNLSIITQKDFHPKQNEEVKIVNLNGKLMKKRTILSKDHYIVQGYKGNMLKLKSLKSGGIEYRPRYLITKLSK